MKSKTNKTAEVKKPTTVAAETKTTETKKNGNGKQTVTLNSECEKVLKVIVKNDGIGASEIRKKLKWGYVPSRALSQLKDDSFATMDDDKGYHVTAAVRAVPAYDLTVSATGADAAVLVPDSILAAARLPQVQQVISSTYVVDPRSNFPLLFFTWVNPVNQTLNFTTAVQFNAARGRLGFGARLKVN